MPDSPQDEADYSLLMPFWIDTDGYTDRDRLMFVAGVEFEMARNQLNDGWTGTRTICRENESRLRMMCARLGLRAWTKPCTGYEQWSELTVEKRAR